MTGIKKCHVAIVDDGISESCNYIPSLLHKVDFTTSKLDCDYISHGTIVLQIISKYNSKCKFSSVKVLDNDARGTISSFAQGIEWCIAHNVDVIHMSIGTTYSLEISKITKLINQAIKRKIIIIASQSNDFIYTIPACLDGVIGVRNSDEFLPCDYIVQYSSWEGIDILTSSRHILNMAYGQNKVLGPSNSFASPYITALVAKIINEKGRITKNQMLNELSKGAKRIKHQRNLKHNIPKIHIDYQNFLYSKEVKVVKKRTCPIIAIHGTKEHSIRFTTTLIEQFCNKGYNIYPISEFAAYPTFISREKNSSSDWLDFIAFLELKYEPDLFLVFEDNNCELCDLSLILDGEEVIIEGDNCHISTCSILDINSLMDKVIILLTT